MLSSAAPEFVVSFFILSGFFINHSFEKNNWTWKRFMLNRIIRIYPPFIASVFFSIAVFYYMINFNPELFSNEIEKDLIKRFIVGLNDFTLLTFLKTLIFIKNADYIACNFAYWSLYHEWIFYLIIPYLSKIKVWTLCFSLLFALVPLFGIIKLDNMLLEFVFYYLVYFFIGYNLYDWCKKNIVTSKFLPKPIAYILMFILFIATVYMGIVNHSTYSFLVSAVFTSFTIVTLLKYPIEHRLLYKPLVLLGDISYTLYIFHLPFYFLLYSILVSITHQYIYYVRIYWIAVIIVLFLSYLMYQLVERKTFYYIQKLKQQKNATH
jgi:peptidoglycan/LPS O-acetylase OafA/YrhL